VAIIKALLYTNSWKTSLGLAIPSLRDALHVVKILEFLVERNPEWLSCRDRDGSLRLHAACRRGVSFKIVQSLADLYEASVKSLTPQGDLSFFLACEMPEPFLDTIFILVKLYPDSIIFIFQPQSWDRSPTSLSRESNGALL
jgi:hypothetical protein